MSKLFLLPLVLLSWNCAEKPWDSGKAEELVMLPAVNPISGGHCESSAMLNALNYQGYSFTEAQIVGGGGALGFMYQRGDFPFLGTRSFDMQEEFLRNADLRGQEKAGESAIDSWLGVIKLLKRGIPVVLRVDMRYLPYLYGGKYGPDYMSFGWHMITIFGIDFKKEIAYVTDTANAGLQSIKLADLENARASRTKVFPPNREYFWFDNKPEGYAPDWKKMTVASLKKIVENADWKPGSEAEAALGLGGLEGLKSFSGELTEMDSWIKSPFMLPAVFDFLYGCIETNGTGGAGFRIFYRDFLLDMSNRTGDISLTQASELLNVSIRSWHDLAVEFKKISKTVGRMKSKEERRVAYSIAADKAQKLYEAEKAFIEFLKKRKS
jgi:hypothetical protein